jgi:hypothetical protein
MTKDMSLTMDETMGGLALIVLGILALAGIDPALLDSIAAIVAGVALVFMSMALASEFAKAFSTSGLMTSEFDSGLGAGTLAGVIGVVLGVLAILDVARATLVPVALIVFGAAVFLDFIMTSQTRALRMMTPTTTGESARLAFSVAASTDMASILFGFGLVVLGILALTGMNGEILVAVAFLGLGGYLFLKGTAVVGHVLSWRRY